MGQGSGLGLLWGQDGDSGLRHRLTAFSAGSNLKDHRGHT